MRTVVAHAAHDLRLEERPDETTPGEGQVLVRVAAGGGSAAPTFIIITMAASAPYGCASR